MIGTAPGMFGTGAGRDDDRAADGWTFVPVGGTATPIGGGVGTAMPAGTVIGGGVEIPCGDGPLTIAGICSRGCDCPGAVADIGGGCDCPGAVANICGGCDCPDGVVASICGGCGCNGVA
jgi:hypothetical protein